MAASYGSITLGTTGTGVAFNLGFASAPTRIRFTVGAKGGSSTVNQGAHGACDGTNQFVLTWFSDGTSSQSTTSASKCVSIYERVSGVLTEVVAASFNSFTANGVKLNVTTASSNYQVFVEAEN